ncbi:uncharacterized protein LOC117613315 [Prunus dulcis]|uniref:uncharacterized protein LOC117613315 n=1 Tax=Prunus dulcis TaxID=3755 RepID=UPI00148385F6|nr:uncharacterized protein LOC117613315 [Prunus dulcis]
MTTDRLSTSSVAAAVADQDSGMGDLSLCHDLLCNILFRLSHKDLLKCKMVAKSCHQIISHVWVRRFWSRVPLLGLYFCTLPQPDDPDHQIIFVFVQDYGFLEKSVPDFYDLVRSQKRNTSDNHLDCCNGLVLLYNPSTYQFCVCNPITKQHASIPTTCLHENEYFCAALAFDPIESNHFRVVRIDYSRQLTSLKSTSTPLDMVMDIFSSQSRKWVRHGLQLDPMFIEGFKTFKLCRHFVYLLGVLYSLTSSGKILCIDLNTIKARAFDLPHGPEDDDADDNKMGATTMGMGCLGISRGLVCYVKRDSSKTFQFWSYDDRQCTSGSGGDQWTLRHSVLDEYLKGPVKPYAISPNSHVVFYGTLNWIGSYNFENRSVERLGKVRLTIASPGYHSPFFTLRPCLIPFYCLGERNACSTPIIPEGVAKGVEILSAEVACQCDEQKHREFEWVIINNSCSIENKSPFVFPSEMQLCAEMEEMQQP